MGLIRRWETLESDLGVKTMLSHSPPTVQWGEEWRWIPICREADHYSVVVSCSMLLYLRLGEISSLPYSLLNLRSRCDEAGDHVSKSMHFLASTIAPSP